MNWFLCLIGVHSWQYKLSEVGYVQLRGWPKGTTCIHCGKPHPTPTTEESSAVRFRPGQHWLDPQGRFWAILPATDQDRVETRQRGQTFSVWRPNTPPPGWSRLS